MVVCAIVSNFFCIYKEMWLFVIVDELGLGIIIFTNPKLTNPKLTNQNLNYQVMLIGKLLMNIVWRYGNNFRDLASQPSYRCAGVN